MQLLWNTVLLSDRKYIVHNSQLKYQFISNLYQTGESQVQQMIAKCFLWIPFL